MAVLQWDQPTERLYETGVQKMVLFVKDATGAYGNGVAWNGITAVTESPSGAEATPLYADDFKYLNLMSNEEFGATIEAYTYPDEFAVCDGSVELVPGFKIGQQVRREFGFCYRTTLGNDAAGNEYGYKLHIVYGALAAPSEKAYATINDSPEAITFSWEVTTTPVEVKLADGTTYKPTSIITIDSTKFTSDEGKAALKALEDKLYGTESEEAALPMPAEVYTLLSANVA